MKLEVVVVPVSDLDRAKGFYETLRWRLDADFVTEKEDQLMDVATLTELLREAEAHLHMEGAG